MTEQLTPDILRQLKADGIGDEVIAVQFGTTKYQVEKMRAEHGIDRVPVEKHIVIPEKELRSLKRRKVTDEDIAEMYGVTVYQVKKARQAYDILPTKTRLENNDEARRRKAKYLPMINELYAQGKTPTEIEKLIGIPRSTIYRWGSEGLIDDYGKNNQPYQNRDIYKQRIEAGLRNIYNAILSYKYDNGGDSPSSGELAQICGYSRNRVREYLLRLDADGRIELKERGNTHYAIIIKGAQWLPPSGWKQPARIPKLHRKRNRRTAETVKKLNGYRQWYCDCGREATDIMLADVRILEGRTQSEGWLPLCRDCADLAEEMHETVLPLTVRSDRKVKAP